jgi:hypothetical protein
MDSPFADLENGRRVGPRSDEAQKIAAIRADCVANGVSYPSRKVDDLYEQPFFWYGRTAYDSRDYTILRPSDRARARPVDLPDHFILDGDTKLPGESKVQHSRYLAYRDLGPERSHKLLANTLGISREALARMAGRWRWEERATLFDAQMEAEARRATQMLVQDQMKVEIERRATYLDNEWKTVERGFEIVTEMLNYPVVEKKSVRVEDNGKTIVTIWQPGKWTMSTVAHLMDVLIKAGRLHTGLSTSNAAVKSDPLSDERMRQQQGESMNEEDVQMHTFASQRAEEAYFAACDEWKARRAADPGLKERPELVARVA